MEFSDITGILYTQHEAINIAYLILRRTGKFNISIRGWDSLPQSNKT